MGEEWRRGWHPELLKPKASDAKVLVVGAGPAGLEAAMSVGKRGYEVTVIEASRDLGGRRLKRGRAAVESCVEVRIPALELRIPAIDEQRLDRMVLTHIW